ncbi:MAG: ABC transporter ATP-binding protein [Azospirillum brasilense]|nr:MAG: ABC transporter ATP-binding protein [Azospirillum brasilense]
MSAQGRGVGNLVDLSRIQLTYASSAGPVEAIRDVSLRVADGEFLAIVGPSGCGKSSLLKLVLGLEDASAGYVQIDGVKVGGPRRDVGAVFQSPVLLPWRTVLENIMLPADILHLDRAAARARAEELLQLAGLHGFGNKYPTELSGGMQQRAGIVRALLHDPKVLLMDEPFAALDALTRESISIELQRIWMERRKTILFVTHNISEAVLLADRIIVMSARPGRIVAELENTTPRPRSIEALSWPEAVELARQIRQHLDLAHAVSA